MDLKIFEMKTFFGAEITNIREDVWMFSFGRQFILADLPGGIIPPSEVERVEAFRERLHKDDYDFKNF